MQYFNLVLTNHAIEQIEARGLTKELAWETFNHPDESKEDKDGSLRLIKHFKGFTTTLITIKNDKNEWIVKTIWRDPSLPGTKDARKHARWQTYKKAGFWGKIWIAVKQQLGIHS